MGREDGRYIAVWRAFPDHSNEFDKIEELRKSMPPLAQSIVTGNASQCSGANCIEDKAKTQCSIDVLTRAIDNLVDAEVRIRLANQGVSGPGQNLDAVHKEWLEALTDYDRTVNLDDDEVTTLYDRLRVWIQSDNGIDKREVRLCFRLREPDLDSENPLSESQSKVSVPDGWQVELLLQSETDPSLVVEATRVWDSDHSTKQMLARQLNQPKDILFKELNRAVSIWPKLERLLNEPTPADLELTVDEAETFLRERSKLLRQAGFGVILPDWWGDHQQRLGVRFAVGTEDESDRSDVTGIGIDQLREFHWEVVLGNKNISNSDLEELASLKRSLVHFRGRWVSLSEDDVEEALEAYEEREREMPLSDVLKAGTELENTGPDLPVVDKQFKGELETLFETDIEDWVREADTPEDFEGELRGYQKRGLGWIQYLEEQGFGGILADDMGLGKTIQILARLVQERSRDPLVEPTLVVCPVSVVYNWRDEANSFAPRLSVHIHHGQRRKSGTELRDAIDRHDLIISTYGTVRSDIEDLQQIQFHRVVLDEAQNIKNTDADRTRAIRELSAYHRLALTGTPIENRLTELWSIMDFCNPGLLGTEQEFRHAFARPIEQNEDEQKTEELRRLIRPFILRRSKTDERIGKDLPEKTEKKQYCPLTEEQATLYKAVADEIFEGIEQASHAERSSQVLKLISALKAICNHPRQYLEDDKGIAERSGKLEKLSDLAKRIVANGDQALIFTQYTSMAELIRTYLQEQLGFDVLYLHGGTPKERRDEMIGEFESTDAPSFFLLSLKAGGTGMNLTSANHVIHYDRWWNPAVEDQATDRAYRIGQEENVQVYKLLSRGTIEEAIDRIIEDKKDLADRVLAEGDSWMKDLSDDQLRELVSLSEEAFA
ncbi:DEAD/DEAH box helicase [Natrialbaceae archaeon A-CW1-1]